MRSTLSSTAVVRDVMNTHAVALHNSMSSHELSKLLDSTMMKNQETPAFPYLKQRLYPVLDAKECLIGVVTSQDLEKLYAAHAHNDNTALSHSSAGDCAHDYEISSILHSHPIVAYPQESLHAAVQRMANCGYTCLPVVDRSHPEQLLGLVSLQDLFKVSSRKLDEEQRRERVLKLGMLLASRSLEVEYATKEEASL